MKIAEIEIQNVIVTQKDTVESYQFNITLLQKPPTNTFTIPIETSGLVFYYQPSLTEELNQKEYDFLNSTHAIKNGVTEHYRPLNVVGSYAVYKENINNGETGKLYHIYRPLLVDAKGVETWANLTITKNSLTIICDQKTLETATYPLVIDPTFGKTDKGASTTTPLERLFGTIFTLSEAGTVTKISAYVYQLAAPQKQKCMIYSDNAGSPDALLGTTNEVDVTVGTNQFVDFTFSTPVELSAGDYWLSSMYEGDGTSTIYWDSGGTTYYKTITYNGAPDPFGAASSLERTYSIYATYTTTPTEENGFITYYFNNGGSLLVNGTTISNGTSTQYTNQTLLTFSAVPTNSSYIFSSFNFTETSATTNPYNYTVNLNSTSWTLFSEAGTGTSTTILRGAGIFFVMFVVVATIVFIVSQSKKQKNTF